jgi:DNA-binding XRE family transcriptional regulator
LRKKTGYDGKRPTDLGIEAYRYVSKLHPKFLEGRTPPAVPLDSVENIEWYEEQLRRCVYGFEYKGQRITGDHYWFLNMFPFLVSKLTKKGETTTEFDTDFPYWAGMHDYLFKTIEQAHYEGKGFCWMSGRGSGKTYAILSILAKIYHLKPKSHTIVSASNSGHATESFTKLLQGLDALAEVHPTLALHRLKDTVSMIESGQEVTRDGIKYKEGPRSRIQKVIYGDNPGATRGTRPDAQLLEEVGDWAVGKGDLKSCIGASIGSWRVGSINKCRVFMIGTGGSVASDQIKDVFSNPDAYNLLQFKDFAPKSCFFLPADYFLGGQGWEGTGVNDNKGARAYLEAERERTKDDMEIHSKIVQEFPFTIEEVFRKSGTNNFNQRHLAEQWTRLNYEWKERRPERGFLTWIKSTSGSIKGVKWEQNPEGNIEIIEHPYKGPSGKEVFQDLYVGGVDSIDQGIADSTSIKNRSSLACLIKKRIVDGKFFSQTSNIYVAKYVGRSVDVRWDYEETLKLSMYYNAKMNIEYTKIGVVNYFREAKQYHRLLKRPLVAMPSKGEKIQGLQKDQSNLIGTPASANVIDHQDGKVKEYIEDYYSNIFFLDLLEQLRDYQREDRRKYDLVIAMGLCELADEDMFGIAARGEESSTSEFQLFGYYTDDRGIKHFGKLPATRNKEEEENLTKPGAQSMATWIDMSGKPRFDDNFDVGDADDLPAPSSPTQI